MKWRIKRKKIKKHHICDMWLKSINDWYEALYIKDTDLNNILINIDNYIITHIRLDMSEYDWNQYIKEGKKIGFGYRDMNHYANERGF